MPARCSFRISAAWSPAVIGRPTLLPFIRAWAPPESVPARSPVRSWRRLRAWQPSLAPPLSSDPRPRSATPRRCPDARVPVGLPGDPLRSGPSDLVAIPIAHRFSRGGRLRVSFRGLSAAPRRARVHLTNLRRDRPAAPRGILPLGSVLHRQSRLVIGGNTGIQWRPQHFRRSS